MFRRYFLIIILFIFSFNVFSSNIEHNCHHKSNTTSIMEQNISDCDNHDCCEDMSNQSINQEKCDCSDCDFHHYISASISNDIDITFNNINIKSYQYNIQLCDIDSFQKPPILI